MIKITGLLNHYLENLEMKLFETHRGTLVFYLIFHQMGNVRLFLIVAILLINFE